MSDLIRRNKAVPVQARRVEPEPDTLQIPGAGHVPVPPAAPGVTQNIIYVNVPAGHSPPPAAVPPAQPGEVHVHNHIHEYPRRSRRGRYGTSFLGTLGFVLGGVACGTDYVPQLIWLAKFIAMAGAACAGLGLLGSMVIRRNGRGMPLLGLLVSALGYGLWMIKTGQGSFSLPRGLNVISSPQPAPVVQTPESRAPTPAPVAIKPPAARVPMSLDNSWFTKDLPSQNNPSPDSVVAPSPVTPPAMPSATPAVISPPVDIKTATANLETAREAAAKKMGIDYTTARTVATDARHEYEQVQQTSPPGSPDLMTASRQRMDADAKLLGLQKELRTDPVVASAEQALKTAKAAGR